MTVEEIKNKCDNKEVVNISTPEDYNNMITYLINNASWDSSKGYRTFNIVNEIDFNGNPISLMAGNAASYYVNINGNAIKNAVTIDTDSGERTFLSINNGQINDLSYKKCIVSCNAMSALFIDSCTAQRINFEKNNITVSGRYYFIYGSPATCSQISTNSKITAGEYFGARLSGRSSGSLIRGANLDVIYLTTKSNPIFVGVEAGGTVCTLRYYYCRPSIITNNVFSTFTAFNNIASNSTQSYFSPDISDISKLPNSIYVSPVSYTDIYYDEDKFSGYTGTITGNPASTDDLRSLLAMRNKGWSA